MKLIATKTSTAGEMMLTEQNPNCMILDQRDWQMFEISKFSMLTDDPLQEGQEVDREEYDVVDQFKGVTTWVDDLYHNSSSILDLPTRQILRRKAVAEKKAGEWVSVEERLPEGFWADTEQEYYKRFSQLVNVYVDNGSVSTAAYNRETKKWFIGDLTQERYQEITRTTVTHWMPLPSAPQTK